MRIIFWFLIFFILALRIYSSFIFQPVFPDGTKIRVKSRIASQPIVYGNFQKVTVEGYDVYLPSYPEISYADRVVIEGKVQGKKLIDPKLIELEVESGILSKLRKEILGFYQRSLPQPHSGLVGGLTLGAKTALPLTFWKALVKGGTAHVVVASGMNVSLVAKFLISLMAVFLPRRRAIPFAVSGVWIYSLLSGFDAPIVRAAIMGSLGFAAQELGRLYDAAKILFLTGAVMLFLKPQWLTDLGFILSFVATLSLMLFEGKINHMIRSVPKILREGFSTSLAAQIGVAPILFVTFGQFNILSPLINALVLWTVAPVTIIAMAGGILGLVIEPLGRLILWLSYPMTSWFVLIMGLFS